MTIHISGKLLKAISCVLFLVFLFLSVSEALIKTRELLKGETEGLLKLPTDLALLDYPDFRHYVGLYAKVQHGVLNYFVFPWASMFIYK